VNRFKSIHLRLYVIEGWQQNGDMLQRIITDSDATRKKRESKKAHKGNDNDK